MSTGGDTSPEPGAPPAERLASRVSQLPRVARAAWHGAWLPPQREVRVVSRLPVAAIAPEECCCCARLASSSRRERVGARTLIVPYCTDCQRHVSALETRRLGADAASLLLASALALSLPVLLPTAPLLLSAILVAVAWLIPRLIVRPAHASGEPGHAAGGRACWGTGDGLACINKHWANRLAERNDGTVRIEQQREPMPWRLAALALVAPLLALPYVSSLHRPVLRVLNFSDYSIEVRVDGQAVATVEPGASESPDQGVQLRVPAGERELVALHPDGSVVAKDSVVLRAGQSHLWVPASGEQCFWLETLSYSGSAPPTVAPLKPARFRVVPSEVDGWFAPNPPRSDGELPSSGGALTALRFGRCDDVPRAPR